MQRGPLRSEVVCFQSAALGLALDGSPVRLINVERMLGDIVTVVAVRVALHDGRALSMTPMHRSRTGAVVAVCVALNDSHALLPTPLCWSYIFNTRHGRRQTLALVHMALITRILGGLHLRR